MTAEFAVLMPAMVLLLAAVLATGAAALAYVQCLDAARSAARLAARHESSGVIDQAVRTLGPDDARASIARTGTEIRVRVTGGVVLPLPWRPRLSIAQEATAHLEAP